MFWAAASADRQCFAALAGRQEAREGELKGLVTKLVYWIPAFASASLSGAVVDPP
jgi:hypothetical protein